jgi:hypothetical protein
VVCVYVYIHICNVESMSEIYIDIEAAGKILLFVYVQVCYINAECLVFFYHYLLKHFRNNILIMTKLITVEPR